MGGSCGSGSGGGGPCCVCSLVLCQTDLVLSVCSNIAYGTAYAFDMVTVPMEGVVPVVLLLAGVCELCSSAQMSPPKD